MHAVAHMAFLYHTRRAWLIWASFNLTMPLLLGLSALAATGLQGMTPPKNLTTLLISIAFILIASVDELASIVGVPIRNIRELMENSEPVHAHLDAIRAALPPTGFRWDRTDYAIVSRMKRTTPADQAR